MLLLLCAWGLSMASPLQAQRTAPSDSSGSVQAADTRLQHLLDEVHAEGGYDSEALQRAGRLYREMLHAAGPDLASPGADVIRRHVAQAAWLMPDAVFTRVVQGAREQAPEEWHFREGAGTALLAWWRAQDPVLYTAKNERLHEHLYRVARAERDFADRQSFTQFDARGEVYVRYGAPTKKTEVSYNNASFHKHVFRFGVPISLSDFPKNELWIYPELGMSAYYLFVEEGEHFRLARSTNELLPPPLRNGFDQSERSLNKAVSSLAALRYIYEQLAMYHVDFGSRYTDVNNYVLRQEAQARKWRVGLRSGQQKQVGDGIGAQEAVVTRNTQTGLALPSRKLRQRLNESYMADQRALRWRAEHMPRERTQVMTAKAPLAVGVRTARFLEKDGSTRTEVYWSVPVGALRLPAGQRENYNETYVRQYRPLLTFTALHQDGDYERGQVRRKQYLLRSASPQAAEQSVPPQQAVLRSTEPVYHLSLQWLHQLVRVQEGSDRFAPGPLVRAHRQRIDSLSRLTSNAARLEMSDLRPMVLPDERVLQDGALAEAAVLYPFERLASETPLLLYFEVYHLQFDAEGRTRYTVEYEVQRRTERGGLAGLVRPDEENSTATRATYTSQQSRAEEYILLNLGGRESGQRGSVTIVVRVTDEATGQQVERSLTFAAGS